MTIKSALEACHNDVSDGCMLRPIEAEAEAEADADSAANMYAHIHDAYERWGAGVETHFQEI